MIFNSKIKRGLSISPSRLSWVEMDCSSRSRPDVIISANEGLPKGLIKPFFAKRNIEDRDAIKLIIEKLIPHGHMAGDIALSLPDHIAKITSLKFDDLPDNRQEIEQLILWRMKKTVPLPAESIKLDFVSYKTNDGVFDVTASVASREILREYEDLLKEMGLRPRLVDIASLNTLKLFETAIPESSLFIELSGNSLGMAMIDEGRLGLFRSKELEESLYKKASDKIIREIGSTLAYFRAAFPEKELGSICLHSTLPGSEEMIKDLEEGFGLSIVNLSASDYIGEQGEEGNNIDENLAPAIGGALRL